MPVDVVVSTGPISFDLPAMWIAVDVPEHKTAGISKFTLSYCVVYYTFLLCHSQTLNPKPTSLKFLNHSRRAWGTRVRGF